MLSENILLLCSKSFIFSHFRQGEVKFLVATHSVHHPLPFLFSPTQLILPHYLCNTPHTHMPQQNFTCFCFMLEPMSPDIYNLITSIKSLIKYLLLNEIQTKYLNEITPSLSQPSRLPLTYISFSLSF